MSKKPTPTSDSSFGDEFDAWFDAKPDVGEQEAVVEFVEDPKAVAAKQAEAKRAADQAKREADEAKKADDAKKAAEAATRRAEEVRKAEEARRAQLLKLAEEARAAEAETARRAEVERVAAEAARAEAEAKAAEDARAAAAALAIEEEQAAARLAAEAARRAEEEAQLARDAAAAEAAARQASAAVAAVSNDATEDVAVAEAPRKRPPPAIIRVGPPVASAIPEDLVTTLSDPPPVPEVAATELADVAPVPAEPAVPAAIPGEGSWDDVVRTLEREAEGPRRGARLFEAARVARTRLGAPARALALLAAAQEAGAPAVPALREVAETSRALGDLEGAAAAWRTLAFTHDDLDALREYAAWAVDTGSLDDALVERVSAAPPDLRLSRLLVAMRRQQGGASGLEAALGRLAMTLGGSEAAEVYAEQAAALERNEDLRGAIVAWHAACVADPDHPTALARLEALLRRTRNDKDAAAPLGFAELAALLRQEAERRAAEPGAESDAAWWFARSARVEAGLAFDSSKAIDALQRALKLTPSAAGLRRELEHLLVQSGRWADVADSIRAEIAASPPESASFLHFRLGRVLADRLGDSAGALAAWRVAATDPAGAPAAEAVLRLLQDQGDWEGLISFLEERGARLDDPGLLVTVLYRCGEACEGPLEDQTRARAYYERVLDVVPAYLPALEGLERVYSRLELWAPLAAIYEQRALLAEDPHGVALQRHRAGAVYDFRLQDLNRAAEQFRLALDAVPDFAPSLDAYARVLESRGDWHGLGNMLRRAAELTREGNEAVSLYYRAARVLADKTEDRDGALGALHKCLERSPAFLPAILLLKDLLWRSRSWSELHAIERLQASQGTDVDRRHWRLLAAADASPSLTEGDAPALIEEVLREDPQLPAAVSLAERLAVATTGVTTALPLALRVAEEAVSPAARAQLGARAAELAVEAADADAFSQAMEIALSGDGTRLPARALARAAIAFDQAELVPRLVAAGSLNGTAEAVRLGAPLSVAGDIEQRLVAGDTALATAVIRQGAEPGVLAEAHLALAGVAKGAAAATHAEQAGRCLLAAGDADAARGAFELALEEVPGLASAREGLKQALIALKDVEAIKRLHKRAKEEPETLGDALYAAGDLPGAVAAWQKAARTGDALSLSLRTERAQAAAGDWKGVFETLNARLPLLGAEGRAETMARCRWLLAERLASSDEAWEFYRRLHEASPNDVDVLESLARIAGARGETALAARYLEGLATSATRPADAARYYRRLAEAYEGTRDRDAARAAFGRALDALPDDPDALEGLRRLAEADGDWQGVVGVLARLASLQQGSGQIDRFAEIARIWEEKIGDRAVAAEAWRKVLDLAPEDPEALRRLVGLSEASRDWNAYVEYARALLPHLEGTDRTELMRKLGITLAEHLQRDDDAVRFLESASSSGDHDPAAMAVLERILSQRGDWERVVELLRRTARTGSEQERLDALGRAARIKLDHLRDREGASALYAEILALAPDSPEALRYRADYLWEAGDFGGVADIYARLEPAELARDTEDFDTQVEVATFCFRFADALRRAGRTREAMERYQRALELNPNHLPTLEAIGPLYMDAMEWQRADKVWKQVLQLSAGAGNNELLSRVHASLGTVEFKLGQPDKARKRFAKALELRPNDIAALRGLGEVLFAAGDWHNLLNIYNNIIYHTQNPADVIDAYLQKGFVLDARLDLADKASQHYQKSLAFNPGQPLVLLRLAELALRRPDWAEAASLADRGLQLTVDEPAVKACLLLVRAVAYQAVGDTAAAREGYTEAVRLDPWLDEHLTNTPVEDHESVHEALRARLQATARL